MLLEPIKFQCLYLFRWLYFSVITFIDRKSNVIEKSESIGIRRLFNFKVNLFLMLPFHDYVSRGFIHFFSLWLKKVGYSNVEIGLVWSIGVVAEIIFFINQKKYYLGSEILLIFGFHVSFLQ